MNGRVPAGPGTQPERPSDMTSSSITLRDVRESDLGAVLALNNAAGESILPMDAGQLGRLYRHADYFKVAEAVGHLHRRHGLGRLLYCDVQSYAEVRSPQLACEVFLEPRDDISVLFHGTFGFREVGQQVMPESGRRVSLLLKDLCSYPFVRDTYGDTLPPVPWLAGRVRPEPVPARRAAAGL